jgi:hypothetical protein
VADYLKAYAARFELPVQTGVRVDRLSRNGSGFLVETSDRFFETGNVVVAMATFQRPCVRTPIGRRMRSKLVSHGAPLVRVKPGDLATAGIERVPRVVAVRDGLPLLEGERVLEVNNVIWSTGFRPDFSWIDLPVFGNEQEPNEPIHHRGIVAGQPGLYFVGLFFLYAMSSGFLPGVGRDAEHVVKDIASRTR